MGIKNISSKKVVTVGKKDTILDAAKKMREHHIGDVVVVDSASSRKPIGIITDRDVVVAIVAYGVAPEKVYVEDVMSPSLIKARSSDSIFSVIALMRENGVKRLPVVDENGDLDGIISVDDLVNVLAAEFGDIAKIGEKQRNIEHGRRKKLA